MIKLGFVMPISQRNFSLRNNLGFLEGRFILMKLKEALGLTLIYLLNFVNLIHMIEKPLMKKNLNPSILVIA